LPLKKIKSRWVYFAPLGGASAKVFIPALNHAYRNKIKLAANLSKAQTSMGLKKLAPALKKLDILIVNREEASYLTKLPFRDEKNIFNKLDHAVKGIVVVTDGRRGVKVSDGTRRWQAGIFKEKKVRDRTGAGDAFGSAFVAALARKKKFSSDEIPGAIRAGTANAASVVEWIGAKKGILSAAGLKDPRWKKLKIVERKFSKSYNPYQYN